MSRVLNFRSNFFNHITIMSQIVPLQDNLVVKPVQDESTTDSGIIIPDTVSKEKPKKGEVIGIGPGKDGKTLEGVQVGDIVLFTQYAPTEIKVNSEELYILGFDSVLAIQK